MILAVTSKFRLCLHLKSIVPDAPCPVVTPSCEICHRLGSALSVLYCFHFSFTANYAVNEITFLQLNYTREVILLLSFVVILVAQSAIPNSSTVPLRSSCLYRSTYILQGVRRRLRSAISLSLNRSQHKITWP